MEKTTDVLLNETLYSESLDSGLQVVVLPRPGFRQTVATYATRYGSVDSRFILPGSEEELRVPDGIAHFLEHKLFEDPNGDVMNEFSRLGASVNAFTSWTFTNYYFTTTDNFEACFDLLLGFVQSPWFTDETVAKEQGIIEQELRMYNDMPERRSFQNLLESMYVRHPVAIEVGGTVESIKRITRDLLYQCYNVFYHPSNMVVFVAGDVDPGRIIAQVRKNVDSRGYQTQGQIRRLVDVEPPSVKERRKVSELVVAQPILRIAFKDLDVGYGGSRLLRKELLTRVVMEAMLGRGSDLYNQLYEEGLIDQRFGFDYDGFLDFGFSYLGGPTRDPAALEQRLLTGIAATRDRGLAEADFERAKKKGLGRFLSFLNHLANVSVLYNDFFFKQIQYFDLIPTAKDLTLDEANRRLREHFDLERHVVSIVNPKKGRG